MVNSRILRHYVAWLILIILLISTFVANAQISFAPPKNTVISSGTPLYSAALADLNGDGKLDLMLAAFSDNAIWVKLGNGDGTFAVHQAYTVLPGYLAQPLNMETGDFNKDGKADLAISCERSRTVAVMLGNGTGGLNPAAHYFIGSTAKPADLVTGDFNGDGNVDIAVTDMFNWTVRILIGNPDGTFVPAGNYYLGDWAMTIVTGDFNEDGKLDLAATAVGTVSSSGSVRILLGNGNGTFGSVSSVSVGTSTSTGLTASDYNGDNHLDIAVANTGGIINEGLGDLVILPGLGNGSFASPSHIEVGFDPRDVITADFNADGKKDLALRGFTTYDQIAVLTGSGTGTFSVDYTSGTYPGPLMTRIVSGDVDQNGTIDLVAPGLVGLSVFQNTTGLSCVPTTEQNALVKLYNTLGGPTWTNKTNWLGPVEDSWFGVTVTGCHVTRLELPGNSLTGPLPTEIADLTELEVLDLSGNAISGSVPVALGANTLLKEVRLQDNGLIGLPAFASTALTTLAVQNNKLTFEDLEPSASKPGFTYAPQAKVPGGSYDVAAGTAISIPFTTPGTANSYQWSRNSVAIPGATSSSYTKPASTPGDAGNYTVAVTNSLLPLLTLTSEDFVVNVSDNLPTITSFTPTSGPIGTHVTINGTNFGQGPIIRFGGVQSNATYVSPTQLIVKVPIGTMLAPISVTNNERTAFTADPFKVTGCATTPLDPTLSEAPVNNSLPSSAVVTSMTLADMNSDGKLDVVFADIGRNRVTVMVNNSGVGGFTPASLSPAIDLPLTGPVVVKTADIDNDGFLDIVAGTNTTLQIFRQTPYTFSFTGATILASGFRSIALADIDQDGRVDIVGSSTAGNFVSVLRNISTAGTIDASSFATKVDFPMTTVPRTLALDDLDGDGKIDLAIILNDNSLGNFVSIARNVTTKGVINSSTFEAMQQFASGGEDLKIADLDGDGKRDMIVTDGVSAVNVLRNATTPGPFNSGSFEPAVGYATGPTPLELTVGDIDGDGRQDLAVASYGSNSISLLQNNSSVGSFNGSSFGTSIFLPAGLQPRSIVAGDMDNDGRTDLVLGYNFQSIFSLYRNNVAVSNASDVAALTALYNATNGPSWSTSTNWLSSDLATWAGVTVSGCRVTELNLEGFGLNGPMPAELGQLTELKVLDLSTNSFTSPVPIELGNLSDLTNLRLNQSNITGPLPTQIGNLTSLVSLTISSAGMSGEPIPPEIGNLTNLRWLDLNSSSFGGSIPNEIGQLTKLQYLNLNYNIYLTGSLPSSLGNLQELKYMDIGNTAGLNGPIPPEFGNLEQLSYLYLRNARITGSLPAGLGNLKQLQSLYLDDNQITGSIPESFSGLSKLRYLSMSSNLLSGAFPPSMAALDIIGIYIDNNKLTSLPLFTSSELTNLRVYNNALTFGSVQPNVGVPNSTFQYSPQQKFKGDTIYVASGATLSIPFSTDGTSNVYQWFKDGVAIAGATSAALSVPNIPTTGAGNYLVRVTNTVATNLTLESEPFLVYVIASCTDVPLTTGTSICPGTGAELQARGGVDGQYRWYTVASGGTAIAGVTGGTYTTPSLSASATYYVAFQSGNCESTRTPVTASVVTCNNPEQNYLWSKHFETPPPFQIAIKKILLDKSDNTYILGSYYGSMDVDPGPGTTTLPFNGGSDIFIQKLKPNGDLDWAHGFGNTDFDFFYDAELDANDNLILTGTIGGTVDFDPGPGVITSTGGSGNGFILKISPAATLIWSKRNSGFATAGPLGVDGVGNITYSGRYNSASDLDPGTGNAIIAGGTGAYFMKVDANGSYIWHKVAPGNLSIVALDVDAAGNIYQTGSYSGAIDFDPGAAVVTLPNQNFGYYLLKLSSSGIFVWVLRGDDTYVNSVRVERSTSSVLIASNQLQKFDGTGTRLWVKALGYTVNEVTTDSDGNILVTGGFTGSRDFDPGTGVYTMNAGFFSDPYITKLTNDGIFLWAKQIASIPESSIQSAVAVATNINGQVAALGYQQGQLDMDPGPCVDLVPSYSVYDYFVLRLGPGGATFPPPSTTGASACGTSSVTLSASGAANGQYRWYTDAVGGAPVSGAVNSTYVTPLLVFPTTYYVSINNGTCESTRTPVTALIGQPPSPSVNSSSICANSTASLVASGGLVAQQYNWYDVPVGGSPLALTPTFDTPVLATTTNYYVSLRESGGCESVRSPAIVSVSSAPNAPVTTGGFVCGASGSVALGASGGANGEYRWYTVAAGGTAIAGETNNTYVTPNLAATTNYYVALSNGSCESPRTLVQAAIDPLPVAPTATDPTPICSPGSVSLQASGASDGSYRWFTTPTGGIPISGEVNANFVTGVISTTTDFYVAITNGSCESSRTKVTLLVGAAPSSPTATDGLGCGTSANVTLTASGGSTGQYRWYSVPTGGSAISGETNATFVTPIITANTVYYVSLAIGTCESSRVMVRALLEPLPPTPSATTPAAVCNSGAFILQASGGSDGDYRWYTTGSGGTAIANEFNSSFNAGTISTTTTYYVALTNGKCESPRTPVVISIRTCTPPVITTQVTSALIENKVLIPLRPLITDPENDLDESTVKIESPPASGAGAQILPDLILQIDYANAPYSGDDEVVLSACDLTGLCTTRTVVVTAEGDVVVFNAISPNGDGLNDALFIQYIDSFPETRENTFKLFNRWGDLVFSVSDYNNTTRVFTGLNGNGNLLPTGTYFYQLQFNSDHKPLNGYISLKY